MDFFLAICQKEAEYMEHLKKKKKKKIKNKK